ncbi:hypothetical protein ACUR5C_08705 [Aliikangiella sp. IMCC44653]
MNKATSNKLLLALTMLTCSIACFSPLASAETLKLGTQIEQTNNKPKHGITMQQVEAKFGQPQTKLPAVGEPPITRWHYADFTVYFEHNRVIHSVLRKG